MDPKQERPDFTPDELDDVSQNLESPELVVREFASLAAELSLSIEKNLVVIGGLGTISSTYYFGWATSLAFGAQVLQGRPKEGAALGLNALLIAGRAAKQGSELASRILEHMMQAVVLSGEPSEISRFTKLVSQILLVYQSGETDLADELLRVAHPDGRIYILKQAISKPESEISGTTRHHIATLLEREICEREERSDQGPSNTIEDIGEMGVLLAHIDQDNLGLAESHLERITEDKGFYVAKIAERHWEKGDKERFYSLVRDQFKARSQMELEAVLDDEEFKLRDYDVVSCITHLVKDLKDFPLSFLEEAEEYLVTEACKFRLTCIKIAYLLKQRNTSAAMELLEVTLEEIEPDPVDAGDLDRARQDFLTIGRNCTRYLSEFTAEASMLFSRLTKYASKQAP